MRKPVIICIDDEITILDSLKIQLKQAFNADYLVETALGGEDALELVQELLEDRYEIALVISDYIMPDIKGDEVLKRIHETCPKTLKIMLTGQADIEAIGNAIKYAKLYRYIAKPWHSEDLSLTVSEALYSYLQDKKLAKQNVELQRVNQALEEANRQQSQLIDRLRNNENRLNQFIEAMPVGVFISDASGMPKSINSRAQELLGQGVVELETAEQLPEVYQAYLADSDTLYPAHQMPLSLALQGQSTTADDMEIHRDDRKIPIEIWGTPIYNSNREINYAIAAFQDITERKKAEKQRQEFIDRLSELNQSCSRFVPNQFLQLLDRDSILDIKVGDSVQRNMSVLFSDIRSFTTISERMTPGDNFQFINGYLSRMEPAIIENKGFIDKYIGDAIMALFSGSADNAVRAGICMLRQLQAYNQDRIAAGYEPIQNGIGINTGNLILGIVGGQSRIDGTVISDEVNLASRLEGLTKNYGVPLLISHKTFGSLKNPGKYHLRFIDLVQVKGRSKKVSVFEVFDADPPALRDAKLANKTKFEQALVLYYQQEFTEAQQLLTECLQTNPKDNVARIYWQRCHREMEGKPAISA
ncbi:MAG: adenylate/guanylate cyclase domain-containing protein [Geitlerinemataceae cyanobacterium]